MAVQTRKSRKQARRLVPAPPFLPRIAERRYATGKAKSPIPFKGKWSRGRPSPPAEPKIHQRRYACSPQRHPIPWKGRAGRFSFSIRELKDPFCVCAGDISVDGSAIGQALTDGQAAEDTAAVALGEVYVDGSGVGQIGCDC